MFDLDLRDLDLLDAEMVGLHLSDLDLPDPWAVGCLLGGPAEDAIAAGNRDENALTDLEFYARHPERKLYQDSRIQPGEKAAIKEWLSIRDTVVRPALAKATPRAAGSPAPSPAPAPLVPGSNAAVAEQAAGTTRRNQYIAGALGLVALTGIGVAWATR